MDTKVSPHFDLLVGNGDVRALMRAHDWSTSPLGAPDTWSQALRTVVSLMLDSKFPMFIAWGPELGFLYNDAYTEILGAKHPAALGLRFQDIWSEIWTDINPLIERALAGEATYSENLPLLIIRSGHTEQTWFTFSYSPVRDENGAVAGMYCACTEVTNQVLAEKRQAFQLELADVLRGLSDPQEIMVKSTTMLGQYLQVSRVLYGEVNPVLGTITYCSNYNDGSVADITGHRPLADFGPETLADLKRGHTVFSDDVIADPRAKPEFLAHFLAMQIRSGIGAPIFRNGKFRAILNVHHKEHRRWTSNEVKIVEDVAERTWNAIERAHAEAALRKERDRSQGFLDNMAEGFVLMDYDFRVLQINAGGLSLEYRPASEIIGKTHWEAWPGSEQLEVGTVYKRVMAERKAQYVEQLYTYPDGRSVWLEIRAMPTDEGLAVIYHDVTERKRAEEELRRADRRKDEFLAMLAHELRNPLAPIGTAAQLLKMADLDDKRVRATSEIIARQVGHMTRLVDDLLDVSRVTRGLVTLEREPLDLKVIVDSAIEQVHPLLATRHHRLTVQLGHAPAYMQGDPVRLIQILSNLLNNAAKYTPEGGNILVAIEVEQDHIGLTVSDNGIGISPELLPNIFDLFSQGERSPDRSQGGLGLGLALVKNIVELHGGSIRVKSDGVGTGSAFIIRLPRLLEPAEYHAGLKTEAADALPIGILRVMIVDDNADAAQTLAALLETHGHTVVVAFSGEAAVEQAMINPPQVFILDIGLPDMDGYRLASELRALPETGRALFIALTGYGQDHDRERSAAARFDYHLVKPADATMLMALLAEVSAG